MVLQRKRAHTTTSPSHSVFQGKHLHIATGPVLPGPGDFICISYLLSPGTSASFLTISGLVLPTDSSHNEPHTSQFLSYIIWDVSHPALYQQWLSCPILLKTGPSLNDYSPLTCLLYNIYHYLNLFCNLSIHLLVLFH